MFSDGAAWLPWLQLTGVIVLVVGLVYVAWWALFSDRPRGRRRCPRCWYDLSWTEGLTCTECGHAARSERDLLRTRRRMIMGSVAIAGCAAIGAAGLDRVSERGWLSVVPAPALVWLLPVSDRGGAIFAELDRRMRSDLLSDRDWLAVLDRCARGDGAARPAGDRWIGKYGAMTDICAVHFLALPDETLRLEAIEHLHTIPPALRLTADGVWPSDAGATLDVEVRAWWPRGSDMRVRTHPKVPGGQPASHVLRDRPMRNGFSVVCPPLPEGRHAVEVALAIERREAGGPWRQVDERVETVPVSVNGRLADRLTAVRGEELDRAVRSAFAEVAHYRGGGTLPVRFYVETRATRTDAFDDVAVAVRAELYRNGAFARRLDIWWRGGARTGGRRAWEVPAWDDAVLGAPPTGDDRWEVRVRGAPELALRVDGVTKYWDGELTFDIDAAPIARRAPDRGWIREQ